MVLLILLIAVYIRYFRDFTYRNPFQHQVLIGLRWMVGLLLLFVLLDGFRDIYLDEWVREQTGGAYTLYGKSDMTV